MKDPTLVEDSGPAKSNERVRINVGGKVFKTTVSTLTRLDDTVDYKVLSAMVKDCWRNEEELFVDRDPTYFGKVLNYLKDGENFALPADHDARECLRREAEFYNLPGLAKLCVPGLRVGELCVPFLRVGECVQWYESAIDWRKFMARNSETLGSNAKTINYDEWISVKHKMKYMKGYIIRIYNTCCDWEQQGCCYEVKWDSGWSLHNHESELLLAEPK